MPLVSYLKKKPFNFSSTVHILRLYDNYSYVAGDVFPTLRSCLGSYVSLSSLGSNIGDRSI